MKCFLNRPGNSRNRFNNRSDYLRLEPRQLLAGIVFNAETEQVLIGGTPEADHATVTQIENQITVTQEGFESRQFAVSEVSVLHFVGLDGDDYFRNETSIPSRAYGQGGDDHLVGGEGDDRLIGNDGDDVLDANGGNDFMFAGLGDDVLYAGEGDDRIIGAAGNNEIEGNDGNDTIYGGRGDDTIRGGDGDDLLVGWLGDDFITGSDGSDRIHAGEGNDKVYGHVGDDFLYGGAGNDELDGGLGSDVLNGHDGDDILQGSHGEDRIIGGAGSDQSHYYDAAEEHHVSGRGQTFYVTDLTKRKDDGQEFVFAVEEFVFSDGVREPADLVQRKTHSVKEVVYVQPVLVADTNGLNKTIFFGTPGQEADIKARIDEIFAQAEIDVEFLPNSHWGDSNTNYGSQNRDRPFYADRPESDLDQIVSDGDSKGFGNRDGNVIDMYFVDRVPGFDFEGSYVVNGLAFVDAPGVAIHVGEALVRSAESREIVAEVVAHEIGHNLGLYHEDGDDNLLSTEGHSDHLTAQQIATMIASPLTQSL